MKRVANGGLWLPDGEADQVMMSCGAQYQGPKLQVALRYVKGDRTALDIGAHCGLWTVQLGNYFRRVECFEPIPAHIECWNKNAGWKGSCSLHEVALGESEGVTGMHVEPEYTGKTRVNGEGAYAMRRLDSYGINDVDLIKIDVEGYEYFVVKGGEETILRNKPVMIVEQKKGLGARYGLTDTQAVDHLVSLGAKVKAELMGDYVLAWE